MVSRIEQSTRIDIEVRRRDRFFVALAVPLFIVIITPLMWMILLACFWGLLDRPWLAAVPGVIGTALLIGWGIRLGRGSLAQARGSAPHLVLTRSELHIWDSVDTPVPLSSIRVVAVDQPERRGMRADRVRFPVGSDPSGPVGWLSCPDESPLPGIGFGLPRAPNLAVIFTRPMPIEPAGQQVPGFVVSAVEVDAARAAFADRGVTVRPLSPTDLAGIRAELPVRRHGAGGLREVRAEDRTRARLFDAFAILALFFVFAAVLAPAGRDQVAGVVVAFGLSWFVYEVPASALTGQTLGKALLGLRVVRVADGRAGLGLGIAVVRWLLRMLNGVIGAPAGLLASGDALGRAAPRLSLVNGVGAGTLVVADGEYRRLRSLHATQRELALATTVREIETCEPTPGPFRAWISLLIIMLLAGATLVPALARTGSSTRQPDGEQPPLIGPTAPGPLGPLPSEWIPPLPQPSVPLPTFPLPSVPLPTLPLPTLPRQGLPAVRGLTTFDATT